MNKRDKALKTVTTDYLSPHGIGNTIISASLMNFEDGLKISNGTTLDTYTSKTYLATWMGPWKQNQISEIKICQIGCMVHMIISEFKDVSDHENIISLSTGSRMELNDFLVKTKNGRGIDQYIPISVYDDGVPCLGMLKINTRTGNIFIFPDIYQNSFNGKGATTGIMGDITFAYYLDPKDDPKK